MESSDFDTENQPEESLSAELPHIRIRHAEVEDELEDDEEEIQMSSQEVLESLQRAWINEKFAPDLLPYDDALVEMVMTQLVHMEENLATTNKNDLLYIVHRMEVERIRFVVASYLRCRLQKLETYAPHILEVEAGRPRNSKRLSPAEHKFAVDFHESVENHFQELVTRHIPQNHQDDERSRRVTPNVDAHVFARARQDVGEYSLAGGVLSVNIRAGAVHLFRMSYKWHHNFPKIAREAGFTIRELSVGQCIDWRFIASIDPYGIVSEKDYEKLDEFIPHIAEVPIGSVLNNRILDPAIGKYFVLAQFSVQYLLFCKKFLDETVLEIRNTVQSLQDENVRLEKLNKKRTEEVILLQRKLQRVETMEQQYAKAIYPCTKCTKNFISSELLNAHMMRKHASIAQRPVEHTFERKPATTDINLINTIKLELEVKQLKERLNAAEKDLHMHRTKHHRCRVCSEDSSSATERPPAKVLHSVAIQSNMTDDKDSNDKIAQTQTDTLTRSVECETVAEEVPRERAHDCDLISKSDLKSFLEEQKSLFENWKKEERQTLNQEMESVKRNLVNVIQTMEHSERNTPTPVVDDSNIWKDRYHELEKIYQNSQRQCQESVASLENVYAQKMKQLEQLFQKSIVQERKESQHDSNTTSKRGLPQDTTNFKMVTLPSVVIQSETIVDNGIKQIEDTRGQTISSDTDQAESGGERQVSIEIIKTRQSPMNIPFIVEEAIVESKPQVTSLQTLLISPKKQILTQFRARLKAIGVDPRTKQLFGEHLNVACKALADRRDVQKQKHSHFFITRNQLLSKVDQIARMKIGGSSTTKETIPSKVLQDQPIVKSREKPFSSIKAPAIKPRLKTVSGMELLPSKQKLQLPDTESLHQPDMNIFKSKAILASAPAYRPTIKLTDDDIITVHADVSQLPGQEEFATTPNPSKRAPISSYDQQVERLLHTPIKTIHPTAKTQDRINALMAEETIPASNNETVENVSLLKPMPKKRVLFNLDKEDYSKAATISMTSGGQPTIVEDHLRSLQKFDTPKALKVDDESDWNITPEATDCPSSTGASWHDSDGNFWYRAARYFGWLMPYTIGLYTALALANSEPQMVASGLIGAALKMPVKLMTRYGVQAMNQSEMVTRATLASFISVLVFWASCERSEATFIFFACSRMFFSLQDEGVRVDDGQQRQPVHEDGVDDDVRAAQPGLGQVVGSAGGHVTLRHVSVPSEERGQSPEQRESPHAQNAQQCSVVSHRLGRQTLHDDVIDAQPNSDPSMAYSSQANGPKVQVSCQQFITIGGPIVNIMKKSEKARLTTSKLEGVRSDLVLVKMYITQPLPVIEIIPSMKMAKPRIECHSGFIGGNWFQ
uniref:GINS complex subunit 4 n=1 Tax=Anopheles epiroticus TaxID=199890 RepID=A0A182PYI7_9DIPT